MWVDEQGRIARPAEQAWTYSDDHQYGDHILTKDGLAYVAALKDWVANGEKSKFHLSDAEYRERVKPRAPKEMEADASFKLAVWFHDHDNGELAAKYWKRAQELNPDDWNYARQDWSFTPAEAGKKWMQKLQSTDKDYKYYPKLDIQR
jgi:hypothetical protein